MSLNLLKLDGRRRLPFIQQSETSECGLACVAMVADYHGYRTSMASMRRRFGLSLKGATLKDLIDICTAIGFNSRPVRGELADLPSLQLPAILHWNLNHFVVLKKVERSVRGLRYHIHDPAVGAFVIDEARFSREWTGVALELSKSEKFKPKIEPTSLRISQLWTSTEGFYRTFGHVLLLSLLLQIIVLATPFYLQITVDTVLPAADTDLLFILALGFGGLVIIDLLAGWLRSLILVQLNSALSYQIIVNLFRHLLRLPLAWFEKRHIGDVISRFGSTRPITQLLSEGMLAALIDGIMAIATLILMFVYSVTLGMLALVSLLFYVAVRFGFLHAIRLRNVDVITTAAKENSIFIESVRGIAAVKSFGQESNRQRLWQQSKADAVNAEIKLGRLSAAFDSMGKFIVGMERVIFVYVAITLAFEGLLTLGMIFAFQAYKQRFLDASMRLVEQAVNFKILQVHLARIADIATSQVEVQDGEGVNLDLNFDKPLGLQSITYSYGRNEKPVLRGITLAIEPREKIVLVGPSGGGKTTLLKIMGGVFSPGSGALRLGEQAINGANLLSFRRRIGTVAQGDMLYAGTLAENIALFDPEIDMARVREVSRIAHIAEEIEAMPLAYETLVGDMGSVLSGGQLQRVLLARAIYPDPDILFIDEGTANLDPETEKALVDSLSALDKTMVLVAHRPQTIELADRVFQIRNGVIMPVRKPNKAPAQEPATAQNKSMAENAAAPPAPVMDNSPQGGAPGNEGGAGGKNDPAGEDAP